MTKTYEVKKLKCSFLGCDWEEKNFGSGRYGSWMKNRYYCPKHAKQLVREIRCECGEKVYARGQCRSCYEHKRKRV